jgi:hypothetical protein
MCYTPGVTKKHTLVIFLAVASLGLLGLGTGACQVFHDRPAVAVPTLPAGWTATPHYPTLPPAPTRLPSPTPALAATFTPLPTATPAPPTPTSSPTKAAPPTASPTLAATPTIPPLPTATLAPAPAAAPGVNHLGTEKVVLADYVMWYDPDIFDGTKTWDVPAAGPYNSDDYGTIQRHVAQARQACLDGFAVHWYGPTDRRTTNNFNQLLQASAGTSLRHAMVILTNVLPGASEQMIVEAIKYVIANWSQHPNYLRLGGRPVIVFTDMPRPWGSDEMALSGWTRIRAATDPNHNTIWLAEGLVTTYNPLFDGLYVYRIDHRDYPQSWLKQPRWAAALRAVEQQGNLPLGGLYFADTIAAGFDDTRSVNAPSDLRSDAPHFARDRQNGGYYEATFAVTAQTGGDLLFVKSFNEWIEGTEIEPGVTYGDLYLKLTCQYANIYRGR